MNGVQILTEITDTQSALYEDILHRILRTSLNKSRNIDINSSTPLNKV
jgi:hypothetical protein